MAQEPVPVDLEADEPAANYLAATDLDFLGRPAEFIEADSEEARKMWDERCWNPSGGSDGF